jgi:hypothetical protein
LPGLAQTAINSLAARHSERVEKKTRQAQDEYKSTIEKYNSVRTEYEKRYYDGEVYWIIFLNKFFSF